MTSSSDAEALGDDLKFISFKNVAQIIGFWGMSVVAD